MFEATPEQLRDRDVDRIQLVSVKMMVRSMIFEIRFYGCAGALLRQQTILRIVTFKVAKANAVEISSEKLAYYGWDLERE